MIFFSFKHCKLELIDNALDLVTENCYFGSVDLKYAYYSIPRNTFNQKSLKLFCINLFYQYILLR